MQSLSLSCAQTCSPELALEQRRLLQKALALRLELHAPSFPNPTRGLEGILAADSFLKEIKAVGLLIGGLAETVWNRRRTEAELAAHKDVDVLVMPASEPIEIEEFAAGIDWWMPHDIHFDSIKTRSGEMQNITRQFWINGFGCSLCYRIKTKHEAELDPGLYFPSPELAVEIRISECLASIGDAVTVVDEDTESFADKFRKKLGVRSQLPSFIARALGRNPVPYRYGEIPLRVEEIPMEEQVALNGDGEFHVGQRR